jgi:hypothetical protein
MTIKVRCVSEEHEMEQHPTNVYEDIKTVLLFAKQRSYTGYESCIFWVLMCEVAMVSIPSQKFTWTSWHY